MVKGFAGMGRTTGAPGFARTGGYADREPTKPGGAMDRTCLAVTEPETRSRTKPVNVRDPARPRVPESGTTGVG